MNENEIPNCYRCKWHINMLYAVIGNIDRCSAQGFKHCEIAYNTENCKILFEQEVNKNEQD